MKYHPLIVILLAFAPTISVAEEVEKGWILRLGAAAIHSSATYETDLPGYGVFRGEAENGWGIGLGAEYRFNRVVGLEPSLFWGEVDADFVVDDGATLHRDSDRLGMTMVTLAVNLHFLPRGPVDLYAAPSVSWIDFSDMEAWFPELDLRSQLTTGSDVAPGLALGLDVPLGGQGWRFSARLRYLNAESEETDNPPSLPPIRVAVDPWILDLGVAYRF